jgi:hypothetical protein
MYSQSDIERAVQAGAISAEQARSFRDYVAASKATPTPDEEHLYLFTGFNDVFTTIAVVFALIAAGMVGNLIPPNMGYGGPSAFAAVFVAAAAWGLGEVFTLRRRMALPSFVLAVVFPYAVLIALFMMVAIGLGPQNIQSTALAAVIFAVCFLLTGLGAWIHWQRFQVPVSLSLIVMSGVGAVLAILAALLLPGREQMAAMSPRYDSPMSMFAPFGLVMLIALLLMGVAIFLYAMWWDGTDLKRETSRSEVAFWLHSVAAAMIVHPLFSMLGLSYSFSAGSAAIILLLYIFFALIALIVDRRVILVTSIGYLLLGLAALLRETGAGAGAGIITLIAAAAVLLLLALKWSGLREGVIGLLPEPLQARVPAASRPEPLEDVFY